MPCSSTSQLTNAPATVLPLTLPQTPSQWNYFVARLQDIINSIRDASTRQPVNVVPADYAVYNGSALPALSINGATAALDTTKHQFGAASLKLTATAATVTVEFSADPILLPPNADWIESVYIQSSRTAIAGTLALDTPGGSYPVNISGSLLPGTWGRLYGDCDLRADSSTTATMALTLTGCSVGDTFNLEGWQIEHATGSTNLPSPFVNTTVPQGYVDTVDNAVEALTNANNAQTAANQANAQLAAIASDGTLSPPEKPVVIRDYAVVTNEQAGIDAQALAYLGAASAQQVAYDNAVTALTNYLATLTTPTAWNDKSGNTTVVAATFDATWNTVYENRQVLLNAIYQKAQSLANTAQSTANTAQTTGTNAQNTANTAITQLGNLANSQYLQNPFFSTGDLTGWTSDHGSVYFESGSNGPSSASTSYAVFPHGTASEALRNAGRIPVYPGAVIKAQCAVRGLGTPNGTCGVRISWRGADDLEIGSTMTPNPSTGNATNGTYVTGTAPAGAMFAHVECATSGRTDTGGYYTVDNFAAWALADSLDQVPDGPTYARTSSGALTGGNVDLAKAGVVNKNLGNIADGGGRYGVHAVDPNNLALVDFSQAGHVNKVLDNIGDGPTYRRMPGANMDANRRGLVDFTQAGHLNKNLDNIADSATYLRAVQQAQTETVDNANFEASTALPVPGWTPLGGASLSYITGFPYEGTQSMQCFAPTQFGGVTSNRVYKCSPGEVYVVDAACLCGSDPWAFGFRGNGGAGSLTAIAFTGGWARQSVTWTVPSGITSFQIILYKSGTTVPDSADLDDVHLKRIRVLDSDIMDGTTYGRTANADLYVSGGVNRVGLRIAGSGQTIGDQRNLNPITWAGVRSTQSVSPLALSYDSAAPANLSFTCAAVGFQGGGYTINYNASSASTTQTRGTGPVTYYFYYRDANGSGGSKTLNFTTNQSDLSAYPDVVYLGLLTIAIPAGTGTGSGTQFNLGGQSGGGAGALPAK